MCDQLMRHGERIATLEARVENIAEVQEAMVSELRTAADGLRSLALKIDTAVRHAENSGCPSPAAPAEAEKPVKRFSQQINEAWEKFTANFVLFLFYMVAGGFGWAIWKTVTGDWKGTPFFLRPFIGG